MACCILGFSPDHVDPVSKMAGLHVAVIADNLRAIEILLQYGAQVNVIDECLSTPLHFAISMNSDEVNMFTSIVFLVLDCRHARNNCSIFRLFIVFFLMVLMSLLPTIPAEIRYI
jgi:hypothetical protein